MEPEGGSIPNESLSNAEQFQMVLQQIYYNPSLDSQCFMLGREQTVKLWILNLSGWNLRHGAFPVFQVSYPRISHSSRWT